MRVRLSRAENPVVAFYIIPQHRFPCREISVDHAFDGLFQQGLPNVRIGLRRGDNMPLLLATANENDKPLAVLAEINAIARAVVDPVLKYSAANGFGV